MKKKTLLNTILLLCINPKCQRMVLAPRADYEKGSKTKDAVFLVAMCAWCQEPGNFYGEEEEYYGTQGSIEWFDEVVDSPHPTGGETE